MPARASTCRSITTTTKLRHQAHTGSVGLTARTTEPWHDGEAAKAPTAGTKAAQDSSGDGMPAPHDDWERDPEFNGPAPTSPSDIDVGVPGKTIKTKIPKGAYRADSRDPGKIFPKGGFKARPGNHTLKQFVDTKGNPAHLVSTSDTFGRALDQTYDPGRKVWDRWVYEIHSPQEGIDVNATLGKESPYKSEREIAYVGRIDAKYIRRARRFVNMKPVGDWVDNPEYEGPQ